MKIIIVWKPRTVCYIPAGVNKYLWCHLHINFLCCLHIYLSCCLHIFIWFINFCCLLDFLWKWIRFIEDLLCEKLELFVIFLLVLANIFGAICSLTFGAVFTYIFGAVCTLSFGLLAFAAYWSYYENECQHNYLKE